MAGTALSLCVFCGARPGSNGAYSAAAKDLGTAMGARGWRLVYGAGDVGIMGDVAGAAMAAGAETFGVIPEHLVRVEMGKTDLSKYIVTQTMHERKKVMFMNADAIAILPGGAGSLDEFFEVLTWAQLALHRKPIVLINVAGYWDPLVTLIDHIVAEKFAEPSIKSLFSVAKDVDSAVSHLELSAAEKQ